MGRNEGKTEAPTQKRRRDARRDGRVARSQELAGWVGVLAVTMLLPGLFGRVAEALRETLRQIGRVAERPDTAALPTVVGDSLWSMVMALMPTLLAFLGIAVVVNLAQVGFLLTVKPLKPTFSRLNPLSNLRNIFSVKGLWSGLSAAMKLTVIGVVAVAVLRNSMNQMANAPLRSARDAMTDLAATSMMLIRVVAFAALLIALADYAIKRRQLQKELKMTKQEIRQELKDSDGDPTLKARQRSTRLAMSRNRMLQSVGQADVVITNPTHLAVALRYRRDEGAPRVVARGADALAARIRAEADRAGVPRVEAKPLAQVLYRVCRPGEEIPPELFQGVATVLAFLHRLGRTHVAFRGRLGLYVPDTWSPSGGELVRVPPRRRRMLERRAQQIPLGALRGAGHGR